jgi:hypothetical protein
VKTERDARQREHVHLSNTYLKGDDGKSIKGWPEPAASIAASTAFDDFSVVPAPRLVDRGLAA